MSFRFGFHLRLAASICAALVALLWLGVRSAHADAPQCDSRGAITFAPNPVLDVPNASVDVGQQDDCDGPNLDARAYEGGRAPTGIGGTDVLVRATSLPQILRVIPAAPTATFATAAVDSMDACGVRTRLDRPPRS